MKYCKNLAASASGGLSLLDQPWFYSLFLVTYRKSTPAPRRPDSGSWDWGETGKCVWVRISNSLEQGILQDYRFIFYIFLQMFLLFLNFVLEFNFLIHEKICGQIWRKFRQSIRVLRFLFSPILLLKTLFSREIYLRIIEEFHFTSFNITSNVSFSLIKR